MVRRNPRDVKGREAVKRRDRYRAKRDVEMARARNAEGHVRACFVRFAREYNWYVVRGLRMF